LGCQLGEQHSYCSVWRCAAGERGYLTCAECAEYPCQRLRRALGEGVDSFISHKPAMPNLERIRHAGIKTYLGEARERRKLAEELLEQFNEGRSMSFYCAASALLPPAVIRQALTEVRAAIVQGLVDGADPKTRAKAMRLTLEELARVGGVDLKLRKRKN
jgi:predicted Fe-Mo cluster-binding NifX family protein